MRIAAGSASELEYQCILAQNLGYLPEPDAMKLMRLTAEVCRMLGGLIDTLTQAAAQ